jgi:hypothetical protein
LRGHASIRGHLQTRRAFCHFHRQHGLATHISETQHCGIAVGICRSAMRLIRWVHEIGSASDPIFESGQSPRWKINAICRSFLKQIAKFRIFVLSYL